MTRLCGLDDLPRGGSRGFDPSGAGRDSLFVVRVGDAVYGYRDSCPHQAAPMAWRKDAYLDAQGTSIVCSAHGALFDIETGLCRLGPCIGQSLQPVPLRVTADGCIEIKEEK